MIMKMNEAFGRLRSAHERNLWCPDYTRQIYSDGFSSLIDRLAIRVMEIQEAHPFDAIVGCGHSGLPVLGALSYVLRIPIITVRKGTTDSHSTNLVEGHLSFPRPSYLIVDDLVSSGETVGHMVWAIEDRLQTIGYHTGACVGVLTYSNHDFGVNTHINVRPARRGRGREGSGLMPARSLKCWSLYAPFDPECIELNDVG